MSRWTNLAWSVVALLMLNAPSLRASSGDQELSEPAILSGLEMVQGSAKQPRPAHALAFSPDGRLLISGGEGPQELCFWDAKSCKLIATAEAPGKTVRHIAFTADGSRLVTFGDEVTFWDMTTRKPVSHWHLDGYAGAFALSPDGKIVALGRHTERIAQGDLVEFREANTGRVIRTIPGRGQTIRSLAFSGDGKLLAAAIQTDFADAGHQVQVWDVGTGAPAQHFKATPANGIESVTFLPEGRKPGDARGLSLWSVGENGPYLLGSATSVASTSRDGSRALGQGDCGPAVQDLHSGRLLYTLLTAEGESPVIAALSPDGRTVAGADRAGHLTVWTTDRALAAAANRLPVIRCELVMDRTQFLIGEPVAWRCRLTNVSDKPLPVYAGAGDPQRAAVTLKLKSLGRWRIPQRKDRQPQALVAAPSELAPGASVELNFASAGPNAVAAGAGQIFPLEAEASYDLAYVEYVPPAEAGGDSGRRVLSQPVMMTRDPGPAFSHPVYSDWIKSGDGALSVRMHLDSAVFGKSADVLIHGHIRNDSGRKLTIRVPQDDLYAFVRLTGPAGAIPPAEKPTRWPRYVTLDPGGSTIFVGVLNIDRYPHFSDTGPHAVSYTFTSYGGPRAPADLWSGSVVVPPLKFWRVFTLAEAPVETLRPPEHADAK